MRIYSCIDEFSSFYPCIVTIGMFDGVHLGHRKLIKYLVYKSQYKYCTVLITFNPHPKEVLYSNYNFFYINTISEKIQKIKEIGGIDNLVIHPFTKKFSELKTKKFLNKILFKNIKKIIIGYDFHIGKNRDGTIEKLKNYEYNIPFCQINPLKIENKIISSTKIRQELQFGKLSWANKALGYNYCFSGIVIKGKGVGRKNIGFPTANIKINEKKIIPKKGVYAVKIYIYNFLYHGMMNIGINPTINNENKTIKIEIHIFNFFDNIYGTYINVHLIKFIRDEIKFPNINKLKEQIHNDKNSIIKFFKKENMII